jgi:hypothetical protein
VQPTAPRRRCRHNQKTECHEQDQRLRIESHERLPGCKSSAVVTDRGRAQSRNVNGRPPRDMIEALSFAGAAFVAGCNSSPTSATPTTTTGATTTTGGTAGTACVVMPEETAGPYPDRTGMIGNQAHRQLLRIRAAGLRRHRPDLPTRRAGRGHFRTGDVRHHLSGLVHGPCDSHPRPGVRQRRRRQSRYN